MYTPARNVYRSLPVLLIISRLMLIIALPLEGLRGYGDFVHFFRLAGMGIPYVNYWVEFPPIFPFFSSLLYQFAGGREHIYDYMLAISLSIAQAISLGIFIRLVEKIYAQNQAQTRIWIYFSVLLGLSYGWWYFDPLAELAMMLGLYWTLEGKSGRAGFAIGIGALIKLFPALLLPMVWRAQTLKRALVVSGISLGLIFGTYGGLYLFAPEMTAASIRSQSSKGSWETVWALIDGNFQTGNFGPESERFDPRTATTPRGNPPRIPTGLVLVPFLLIGLWAFWRARLEDVRQAIAFMGITWGLFLLWSPGWSPQWVLYLIPIVLMTLPDREAILMALSLVIINLLEWPVLLSRGYTLGLWLTIPVRALLFVLMTILWSGMAHSSKGKGLSRNTIWIGTNSSRE